MKKINVVKYFAIISILISLVSCDKEISTTPTDPEPPQGSIHVNSIPEGFRIYLDGRFTGRYTPDTVPFIKEESHEIGLQRNLWKDTSVVITASQQSPPQLEVNYLVNPSMYGKINFVSSPVGSSIFLNDSLLGFTTPGVLGRLLPGRYRVKFRNELHRDNEALVTVKSSQTATVSLALRDTSIWVDYNTFTTPLPTNKLTGVTVDNEDVVWIGTIDKGIVKYDGKNWEVINSSNSVLISDRITCVFTDNENNKWIGTQNGGIAKVSNSGYMTLFNKSNSDLPNDNITAIEQDSDGNIWLGTYESLTKISNGTFQNFDFNNSNKPSGWINSIKSMSPEDIWVAVDTFLTRFNGKDNFDKFKRHENGFPNSNPSDIDVTKNGNIWVTFSAQFIFGKGNFIGGVSMYNGVDWVSVFIGSTSTQLPDIFIDKDDIKWISSNNGLLKFYDINTSEAFRPTNSGILSLDIHQVSEDSKGTLWIASGDGLAKYKKYLDTQ